MTYLIVFAVGFLVGGLALKADQERTARTVIERTKEKLKPMADI